MLGRQRAFERQTDGTTVKEKYESNGSQVSVSNIEASSTIEDVDQSTIQSNLVFQKL
jgi:hypothetical protein